MKKWFKKTVAVVLMATMAMTVGMPAFAAEENFEKQMNFSSDNVAEATVNTLEGNFDIIIPYKTYDEFVQELTIEKVDSIPEGATYCSSIREFYDKLYNSGANTFSIDKEADKKLGDLNATFYATISTDNKFISLDNISSDISPLYLGAEWTQEKYTHTFTDSNHVVSGNIYGSISDHILTPLGFIKVGTNSYRVPFEVSTNEFH